MKKRSVFTVLFMISTQAYSIEFEKMNIAGYDKKILSEKQIRFVKTDNPKKVIHLQVSAYDPQNTWKEETLKKDVEGMFETRQSMYKVFGFSDIKLDKYGLTKYKQFPLLNIFGSYKKINDKKVYFAESNIYYAHEFLQVKVINEVLDEKSQTSEKEVEAILTQIKAHELEIKE